ncbi:GNAT family N-acetyltransferase [Paenibacillus assamensis]|uniref:GNAT family N-acetyltransferase n=1 Tax=Paenibacillus assamensis TaxID=311244 RepID=UPI000491775A|nr:GNAT family N-acetyltransferase [Paenibacillus assamensis]
MTAYHFYPMTEEYASIICTWKYSAPYSIYSMDDSNECICELMNDEYFYALDSDNQLVGFICMGKSARVPGGYPTGIYEYDDRLDIGLGLRPDFTGGGRGQLFLLQGIDYLKQHHHAQNLQLVVATFNERAITVYERAGFVRGMSFMSRIGNKQVEFLSMTLAL